MARRPDMKDLFENARKLRELIWKDKFRPCYHLTPAEGFFNDINGTLFWNNRYHLFYLGREPITYSNLTTKKYWVATWDHFSSKDLLHWIQHPPAIRPNQDGSTPRGIYSGGAIKNAPRPTLIYHVPDKGTCIAIAQDDDLITWKELPQNPVIPIHKHDDEFVVFDTAGWYENGTYCALVGNKNKRPGYEGDCTSLFISTDLINWKYQGPFYQSSRKWTLEEEDAACPDFFPVGNKHMLLMHCHRPYGNTTHYYLGVYKDRRFIPEHHGRMSWLGGQLSGPESLIDAQGRNIMFGWIDESRIGRKDLWGYEFDSDRQLDTDQKNLLAWASVVSLPRLLSLTDEGTLAINPVPELKSLRENHKRMEDIVLHSETEQTVKNVSGRVLEISLEIDPCTTNHVGIKVFCSPDHAEETIVSYLADDKILQIDFRKASLATNLEYVDYDPFRKKPVITNKGLIQKAPFELRKNENLKLHLFLDRSVLEVFANGRQVITQRVYPTKPESSGVSLFTENGTAKVIFIECWDISPTSSW